MKNKKLEKLIEKYELKRRVVTELIQKSEPKEDLSKELAVRRFLSDIIYDLKACVVETDSDTDVGLHLVCVTNCKTIKKFEITLVPPKGKFKKQVIYAQDLDEACFISETMRCGYENSFVTKELK